MSSSESSDSQLPVFQVAGFVLYGSGACRDQSLDEEELQRVVFQQGFPRGQGGNLHRV